LALRLHFFGVGQAVKLIAVAYHSTDSVVSVHPEMGDFGSGQGRSELGTAGVATLRRGFQTRENIGLGQKIPFMDGQFAMYGFTSNLYSKGANSLPIPLMSSNESLDCNFRAEQSAFN
jgi:hypothetical protein